MSFYDTAGEDFRDVESAQLLKYLTAGSALILLIDPLTIPQARDQIPKSEWQDFGGEPAIDVICRLTEVLRSAHGVQPTRLIKVPIAVVLTKFDLLFDVLGADHPLMFAPHETPYYDEAKGIESHNEVKRLLMTWGADNVDAHVRLNFAEFRYFAVSSLGANPDMGVASVDARGVRPFRVEEPITWLLSRFHVIDKTR